MAGLRTRLDTVRRERALLGNRALARLELQRRRQEASAVVQAFAGLDVLEVGGPSAMFRSGKQLPVYDIISAYDAANFAASTIWQGGVEATRRPRREFVAEATDLGCTNKAYGGLLASHVLEHLANPIGALREWRRIVALGSPLLVIVPHRDFTFDHRREITPLAHLLEDERQETDEDDLTHVPEVLAYHDPRHDYFTGDAAAFAERCWANLHHRAVHHHVFDTRAAVDVVMAADLSVEAVLPSRPHHIIILARRPTEAGAPVTPPQGLRDVLRTSPFPSDRRKA
jgi:SAM-dependent methyltransferase